MLKLKNKSKEKKEQECHFCRRSHTSWFLYDLHEGIHNTNRSKVPVCATHFGVLVNMTYTNEDAQYLANGQKEYISVKRLERKIGTNQFK